MMERLDLETANIANKNFEVLSKMFPNAVTEHIDEKGRIVRTIDADVLRQEISCDVVEGKEERYQFIWPNKKNTLALVNSPSTYTLRLCDEMSVGRNGEKGSIDTDNIYVEGDNLEVLKVLRETYLNKIKMIYIDPPYNTGKDEFVYDDDFAVNGEVFSSLSGQKDENNNLLFDMRANNESNGRFHTDWLNMIYSRIKISRDFLSDDGVIFISIDDNEQENLKKVCDEVFGSQNFVGMLVLKTATDNNPSQINTEHEYMIVYAKNKIMQSNWLRTSEAAKKIIDKYKELKEKDLSIEDIKTNLRRWIKENKDDLPQVAHYNCVDEKGVYSSSGNSSNPHPGGYMYDIMHPITGKPCPKPANGWRWPEKTFLKYAQDGEVEWGIDETTQPHIKKRIETAVEYLRSLIYEDNRATTKMLSDLFDGHKVFDNPKPISVLKRIIDYVTDEDSYILDFFSGSASIAQAVMELNAEDGGKRHFILVQLPEKTGEKTEAYKLGYKNICDIGEERIKRAGRELREKNANIDIGYRVFKLDSSNMKDVYYNPAETQQASLFAMADNIKEDRSSEDLLFQVMLDLGILISSKIEKRNIAGKEIFSVADGFLMACFDMGITEDVVKAIANEKPYYAVFRDSSMANDSVATNFDQIFASISPDTVRKVL